jgi:hypothetical protein
MEQMSKNDVSAERVVSYNCCKYLDTELVC